MSQVLEIISRLTSGGMSQSEMSRRTGIPQPRISRWASGDVPAGAEDSLKLLALDREIAERRKDTSIEPETGAKPASAHPAATQEPPAESASALEG